MKPMKFLGVLLGFGLIIGAGRADASIISYDYQTTLSLASGTDALGLNGAFLDIKDDVSSSDVYITRFTFPAVVMNNDATMTVSGSSNASNNGTFALPQLAFYPAFVFGAGLFTDPAGTSPTVTLPVGGALTLDLHTIQTVTGASEAVGNTVNILDFGSAGGGVFIASNGAHYNGVNPTGTATISSVPEPITLSFVLASLVGLGLMKRKT